MPRPNWSKRSLRTPWRRGVPRCRGPTRWATGRILARASAGTSHACRPGCPWAPRWNRGGSGRSGVRVAGILVQLAVLEPVEVRMQAPAADVLAGDADEIAGEAAGHGVLVGEDRGVMLPAHRAPQLAIARVGEADAVVVDGELEVDAFAVVERILLLHRPGHVSALAAHQAQRARGVRGAREEQVVEAVGAVEGDQAGHLLEVFGRELHAGRGLD